MSTAAQPSPNSSQSPGSSPILHLLTDDFTEITADVVTSITDDALKAADVLIGVIATAPDPLTFESTLGRLEIAATLAGDAYGRGAFMAKVHTEPEVRTAATHAEERLVKWSTDLVFRRDLYETVVRFAATDEAATLTGPRRRLLDFVLRDFRRAGQDLDAEARDRLQELRLRLVELEVEFGTNLDEWDDAIEVDRTQLAGLPDDYIERLTLVDQGGVDEAAGDEGAVDRPDRDTRRYRVSLDYPEYLPFMRQADDRALRRQLQHKFWNRAVAENRPLLEEAVSVRRKIAELLGYPTWAHHAMEVKMAGGPEAVEKLYGSIVPGLTAKATAELATLQEMIADQIGGDRLESWDWMYAHTRQRRLDHGVDPSEVAQYFPLPSVLDGMLELTGEVFGLDYHRIDDPKAWHPDVVAFEIRNRGGNEPIAVFYADLFPREGKYGHAAAFPLRYGGRLDDGTYRRPVAAIVANFTKPSATGPSLLEHDEAVTLFHEFGHILHFCLTEVDLFRFSGYDTEWDFVEAPSQIMENWMWESSVLQRFARHHDTGAPIPEELVERLVAARDLNIGLFEMRQVFLGRLDLLMHTLGAPGGDDEGNGGGAGSDATPEPDEPDLDEIYRRAFASTLLPFHEDTFFPATFGHLMGGYDAGYYGYMWARVHGDDMFSVFEAGGITSPEVGARYRREVLATGGSRDAVDHLRAFLGREPDSHAFMRRLGLGESTSP